MSNYLSDRRKELGMTMKEVAEAVGVSEATVSRWESGSIANMRRDRIHALAKALKVSPSYIMTGPHENSIPPAAIPFTHVDVRPLPVLGWVNCGSPHFADEHVEGYIETDYATAPDNTYFWLHATGNSMENIGIRDGDLLLIRQQNTIENGEIAVVMVGDDTATLKRVILKENAIILMPENNAYEPQVFTGKETQNVKICGRLMEVRKRF